jgi:MinD superfamily P-loop ATPase
MSADKTTKKPANRRIVFTMGGKGGAGKTTVLSSIISYLQEQNIQFDLFDADVENEKRGHLKPKR